MEPKSGWFEVRAEGEHWVMSAGGSWNLASVAELDARLRELAPAPAGSARIDVSALESLDTAGAWVLHRTRKWLAEKGVAAEFEGASGAHAALLEEIARSDTTCELERPAPNPLLACVARLGKGTLDALGEGRGLIAFLGVTVITVVRVAFRPRRLRLTSFASHIERTGLDAMPIVGLISFLIGVVLAYQGADQLRRFGAEVFTVNLVGISVLREIGILLTAIVVAGRSGSAFTAQIGAMKINDEVDALRTLGLDPIEVLVLPRIFALILTLPLLAFFADLTALAGAAAMSHFVLDISFVQFIRQIPSAVPIWSFWIGIIKAPVFGFLIAMVGCYEGLKVEGSADSLGRLTTQAVVVSIVLVIVVDAAFSILFSFLGI